MNFFVWPLSRWKSENYTKRNTHSETLSRLSVSSATRSTASATYWPPSLLSNSLSLEFCSLSAAFPYSLTHNSKPNVGELKGSWWLMGNFSLWNWWFLGISSYWAGNIWFLSYFPFDLISFFFQRHRSLTLIFVILTIYWWLRSLESWL
jgi:hypothetical protein